MNRVPPSTYQKVDLEKIGRCVSKVTNQSLNIVAPEKKLVVMILGNHSAGKSSFINWYMGQEVQKTKVSIETIEVNLIMHGQVQ